MISREVIYGAAALALAAYLVSWGDRHGFNARRVAAIELELASANARVAEFMQHDEQATIDADVLRDEGYAKALRDLGSADKCIATPAMIQAFERIAR